MQHEDNEPGEGVNDQRRMEFCLSLRERYDQEDLIMECATCSRFYIRCCQHDHERPSYYPCHHYQLVFTDGSCINNGRRDGVVATAGIGAVIGTNVDDQDSRVIDNMVDPGFPRTSQRAELLGALFGLDFLFQRSNYAASVDTKGARKKPKHGYVPQDSASETLVVATDSRYVVEGMTEWYSTWKVCMIFLLQLSPGKIYLFFVFIG